MTEEAAPLNEQDLEERLSRPILTARDTMSLMDGDLLILGVAGKMGPTLARMARQVKDSLGARGHVIGVARFSNPALECWLHDAGVKTVRCDLLDPAAVQQLPAAENVIFMAGQKFGATANPTSTWAMNALAPALAARRFAGARTVVFSTGCVYANTPIGSGGSLEEDPLEPIGEYANSCVARERLFSYLAELHSTPLAIMRLNYAIDLRYGVLLDVALKVQAGDPIDLAMGHVNVIWQGDANARAIKLLDYAAKPPMTLNVTGPETISVRWLAARFGELLGREPVFSGEEAPTALLSNASRSFGLFGYPSVSAETLIEWTAAWVKRGGSTLNKPTHFQTRDGRY